MARSDRPVAARPARPGPARQHATDWWLSALLLVAIGFGIAGLRSLLAGFGWWFAGVGVAATVLATAAVVRQFARPRLWPPLAGLAAGVGSITLLFAPDSAWFGFIPTLESLKALVALGGVGSAQVVAQSIPADAVPGILFLICVGVVALALAADILVHTLRVPALAGVPLLVLLLVPVFVTPKHQDGFTFAVVAMLWLAMLRLRGRPIARHTTAIAATTAIIGSLILSVALPPAELAVAQKPLVSSLAGLNPIIALGKDLRRPDATPALSYNTTVVGGVYLRIATLDKFTGSLWEPTLDDAPAQNRVDAIPSLSDVGGGIAITTETTTVSIANLSSRWLPVPYAPTKVVGLTGPDWRWDPTDLTIRSSFSSINGQRYQVTSDQVAPTEQQLIAAGNRVPSGFGRYLALAPGLPPIVAETARAVVGSAATHYDMAVALQKYFTGGAFSYSESTPVTQGYDSSGAAVLGRFLELKSGYCIHFASAMAAMARTLGIPARIAVGFIPGNAYIGRNILEFQVTTHDLHTWPELYFSGIGWVRFEPTPGRGVAPVFAPVPLFGSTTQNQPATGPNLARDAAGGPNAAAAAAAAAPSWAAAITLLLALVLAAPALIRLARRRARFAAVAGGSAARGWDELRDTAIDLGLRPDDALTPRQAESRFASGLDAESSAALARLRQAVEFESFAARAGDPAVADLRLVLRSMRHGVGRKRRLLAAFAPRSLAARWLLSAARI